MKRPASSSLEAQYEFEASGRKGTSIGSDVGVRLGVNGVDYVRVRPKGTCLTKDQLGDGANREDGKAPLYGTRRVVEVDMMVAQLSWGREGKGSRRARHDACRSAGSRAGRAGIRRSGEVQDSAGSEYSSEAGCLGADAGIAEREGSWDSEISSVRSLFGGGAWVVWCVGNCGCEVWTYLLRECAVRSPE